MLEVLKHALIQSTCMLSETMEKRQHSELALKITQNKTTIILSIDKDKKTCAIYF
jgi:hypothetical protein